MNELKQKSLKRWSHLRFSVIGSLLANPPENGQLKAELKRLAEKQYRHPDKGEWTTFGFSTIERWYYQALNAKDPILALERKSRSDAGSLKVMNSGLLTALNQQYQDYPHWSYQLHADNLRALVAENPELGEFPSYSTILRPREPVITKSPSPPENPAVPPLLRRLMQDYAATGLPPAYLPREEALCAVEDDDPIF
jgi:putative transposase